MMCELLHCARRWLPSGRRAAAGRLDQTGIVERSLRDESSAKHDAVQAWEWEVRFLFLSRWDQIEVPLHLGEGEKGRNDN